VGPLGTLLVEPVCDKEEILYSTLNLSDLAEGRVIPEYLLGERTHGKSRWILTLLGVTRDQISCRLFPLCGETRSNILSSLSVNTKAGVNVCL
jgi:hypothetical protein